MIFEGARDDDIVYPRAPRRRWAWLAGLLLALSACAQVGPVLSESAKLACQGQAAANAAAEAAVALGNKEAAELASATSAYLGLLCKW